ncbi:unnamed protein product [Phytophthora fragariaefolia]|uniref:Unnamed protein product n=1 Tax=Phytophthora fragariaefolia TaxID=1490495 RepID=A0A9W6XW27_9STRA|nr:unnamed protein product [Phytophthora fragariaefolia]
MERLAREYLAVNGIINLNKLVVLRPGPYSPMLNPMEGCWNSLKAKMRRFMAERKQEFLVREEYATFTEHCMQLMKETVELGKKSDFKSVGNALERLMRLHRFMYKIGCFSVQRIPPVGSVAADLYRVKEHHLVLTAAEKRDFTNSIKSVNYRHMQTQGMLSEGRIVDTRSKSCSYLFFCKHSMRCRVVSACIAGGVACPGVSMRSRQFVRQFVRPNHTDTAGMTRRRNIPSSGESDGILPSHAHEAVASEIETTEYPDDSPDMECAGAENDAISSSPVPSIASLATTESLPEDDHEYQAVLIPPGYTDVVLPQPQDGPNIDSVRPGSRRSLRKKKPTRRAIESHLQRLKRMRR